MCSKIYLGIIIVGGIMAEMILLGDEVKDIYTGFKGVVLSKTEFINGCIQFGVTPKYNPKQPMDTAVAEVNIDSNSLVITKKGSRHKKTEESKDLIGGPSRLLRRRM